MFRGSLVYKVDHSAAFHDKVSAILHSRIAEICWYVLFKFYA